MEFSASSPCILSRSLLQVLYQPLAPSQNPGNMMTRYNTSLTIIHFTFLSKDYVLKEKSNQSI
jgi:hypothetical protein